MIQSTVGNRLTIPASLTIMRDSSFASAMVSFSLFLNESKVATIKNGESVTIQITMKHNTLRTDVVGMNGPPRRSIYEFEAKDGAQGVIHLKAGLFRKETATWVIGVDETASPGQKQQGLKEQGKAQKIQQIMDELVACYAGKHFSIHSRAPIGSDSLQKKLSRIMHSLPQKKRIAIEQKPWAEFIERFNGIQFGYFSHLDTMYSVIDAVTDVDCLVEIASIASYRDDVCVRAIYAIKAMNNQDALLKLFGNYDKKPPLDYFSWSIGGTSDFRGGQSIFTLLTALDDEHFLSGLRKIRKRPSWAEESVVQRYKYGRVFINREEQHRLVQAKDKKALKSFMPISNYYQYVIPSNYEKRIEKLASMNLLSKDEMSLYL